jgi:fatty-acid desaturase
MTEATDTQAAPWTMPIWKPARGKEATLFYLVTIHVLAIVGLVLFPIPSLNVFLLSLLFACLGGLGTTVCYHRTIAHRTLKLNPVVQHFLVFWTMFNGSGNPASWASYHRLHHAKSDTPEDVSSPRVGGFWWAHLRWLYQLPRADVKRWAPDLDTPVYRAWILVEVPVILLSVFCGMLLGFGWEGFFWMGAMRLVYCLHGQCFVNSLMHLGPLPEDGDSSRNIWWLGPFQITAWGENWHRNHHSFANSAQFGLHWWQTDIGWYFIRALEAVGLATDVKRPNPKDMKRGARKAERERAKAAA